MKLATLCYVQKDGRTLMVHRIKRANDMHLGKWNGLGGKLEPGETPEECVIREIYEESGLLARDPQLKGILTFPGFANEEDWYTFVYVVTDFTGELIDSPEGFLEWIEDDRLLGINLWEGDRIFIPWLKEAGFFSGKFVYQNNQLTQHEVVWHHP